MAETEVRGGGPPRETAGGWLHPRILLRSVLSEDDTPHHIALGMAVGMFVGLTPTPGIQMLLVLGIYFACRPIFTFNRPAGLAAVYISNPLTAVPLAWLSYQVGRLFVGGDLTREELAAVLGHQGASWWQAIIDLVFELGWAYLIGSVVVAAVGGILAYPVMRYFLHLFRSGSSAGGQAVTRERTPPVAAALRR